MEVVQGPHTSKETVEQLMEFARSIGWDPNDIGYRMNEIFSLTADQLERLKEMAPDFWAKLTADESVAE